MRDVFELSNTSEAMEGIISGVWKKTWMDGTRAAPEQKVVRIPPIVLCRVEGRALSAPRCVERRTLLWRGAGLARVFFRGVEFVLRHDDSLDSSTTRRSRSAGGDRPTAFGRSRTLMSAGEYGT